ncbi:acyl-CoA dehydrogenase family protein [Sphingomonas sanguinis]|jgi:alkylation response protein AidB-like acyl-CoA dehydrogenase|uniref:Acyl-CoA dehydrogenase n=2 Tax=Sphingomonas sanguinis TaxID=33051 RepID=A0A7Y7QTX0_9SPHN|nr:acyl-CoA dehydrogenase family protein [Sphingomonas sanguinis]MBZ6381292.1 acyl-CoA/acyl-ACP dehydrogenase [Sphingomonas sanguinis]NVP30594.1 acyl-CoA dehydrogenase [Sphingomonas sanguinis]
MSGMAAALRNAVAASGWAEHPPGDPQTVDALVALLTSLYECGRRDLPLGRLLEGHVDAVQIVQRYGSDRQRDRLQHLVANGATLGVWNAALAGEPLRLDGYRLSGGKSYASGAGVLSHALVTADGPSGAQLLLLDLARVAPKIDRDWWHVTGMQRSETHRVRWHDAAIEDEDRIGAPGLYAREPYFSGGALRFVAVHAGGIAGIVDRTRDHLIETGRADDPFQSARLAELFGLADMAAAVVRRTARLWFEDGAAEDARLARVAAARLAVTDAAERAMAIAQGAVGLAGHFLEHPLSAMLSDLAVYLRQPVPDAQRLRVGRAVQLGLLAPAL